MKKLTIELEAEDIHEFIYALQYAIKKIEEGYLSVDLRNEDVDGSCDISEVETKKKEEIKT